ncbi:MAG TPA: pirin family protein [Burkholderiaceae bacterium]|jgi:redox-sensitive bicupin YhaK (pirin superfamily)|nr:pirin family protein [Burkholderiaceae bacterium]
MLELRKSSDRGIARFNWLESRHTFSFGGYDDPQHQGFSDLLVINDDRVRPGTGFSTHSHRDMEIFTVVLEGALEHKDSTGTGSVIRRGDMQLMSAGSGIRHSEFNPSDTETVHFLQIWIVPEVKGVRPHYQQMHFDDEQKRGRLHLVLSPRGAKGSMSLFQDAQVYAGLFDGSEQATLELEARRYAYIHVASGNLQVNGLPLDEGDGVRVRDEHRLHFAAGRSAQVLVFDLRPRELPPR